MAVTKTRTRDEIEAAYAGGARVFGENRVFEAEEKYADFHDGGAHKDAELHLIGHLQTNKAKTAAELFSSVQSIDKEKTAGALQARLEETGRRIDILLEINTSGEESKYGYPSEEVMLREIDRILELDRLTVRGFMTIGPFTEDESRIREAFRSLRTIYENFRDRFPGLPVDVLSMGMSGDYGIAIEEGSTMVRVGTSIFGERR